MTVEQPVQAASGEAAPAPRNDVAALAPAPGGSYFPTTAMTGATGRVRGTGACILLMVVTLGIYGFVWYFKTHEEMKRHSGQGLGGGLALVIAIVVGAAMPFITSNEVGALYERRGVARPVSALTGLWYFPGIFLLGLGPIVWFVKTNGALNAYWRSLGAS